MGDSFTLTAPDGHKFAAYVAEPAGAPRGGIVVAMEMYGVNDYVRAVCDSWAGDGYRAIAPDLWARFQPGFTLPYDDDGNRIGKKMSAEADWELALDDLQTAAGAVRSAGKVAIVGFCYGGTLAWLAACRRRFDASVPYYGSDMCDYPDEVPRCPVLCHVGDKDTAVPPAEVAAFKAKRPEVPWHIYPGVVHGFDNFIRPARYDEAASRLARERTHAFLRRHIG